ncbi:siderophore-interacting protein [Humidisolicoccus flavus]|uniref:siderophore-interacting protein n=1 Tax=Humidisolicoccus flavus TaxID=3111414 RepID=UPI003248316C
MTKPASRLYRARVVRSARLSPNFVRVTFSSPEFADLGTGGPDQRIKIIFPLPGSHTSELPEGEDWYSTWRTLPNEARNPMRTYTIRRADADARELDVDFVAHGDSGPASRWIAGEILGDELLIIAPDATSEAPIGGFEWHPGAATTVLVAGDETAAPAICGILETMRADAVGAVFLEVPEEADILSVNAPANVAVTWLPRARSASAKHGALLDQAVKSWAADWLSATETKAAAVNSTAEETALLNPESEVLWEVPEERDDAGLYAWLAGEAGTITGLRRHLVRDLGVDRTRVAFMGYWKVGRAEN